MDMANSHAGVDGGHMQGLSWGLFFEFCGL
jgi:hypothetical protein